MDGRGGRRESWARLLVPQSLREQCVSAHATLSFFSGRRYMPHWCMTQVMNGGAVVLEHSVVRAVHLGGVGGQVWGKVGCWWCVYVLWWGRGHPACMAKRGRAICWGFGWGRGVGPLHNHTPATPRSTLPRPGSRVSAAHTCTCRLPTCPAPRVADG